MAFGSHRDLQQTFPPDRADDPLDRGVLAVIDGRPLMPLVHSQEGRAWRD